MLKTNSIGAGFLSFSGSTTVVNPEKSYAAAYPRQNGLAVALRELGRIERTLFTLEWLQNTELRRRVQIGLNKGAHETIDPIHWPPRSG